MRGVVTVFLAAGGEENRRGKDNNNERHNKERGRDVHEIVLPALRVPKADGARPSVEPRAQWFCLRFLSTVNYELRAMNWLSYSFGPPSG